MTGRLLALLLAILIGTARGAAAEAPQWVVVTAPAFRAALTPLCDHRRAEGMNVIVVQTTDILSTEQIRNGDVGLLKDHVQKLCRQSKGPSYVLLVGATKTANPFAVEKSAVDNTAVEKTAVPPLRGTVGRMIRQPSDNGYGCLDKELLPTVAVGR